MAVWYLGSKFRIARLDQSAAVAARMVQSLESPATFSTHLNQREALDGADFVITSF